MEIKHNEIVKGLVALLCVGDLVTICVLRSERKPEYFCERIEGFKKNHRVSQIDFIGDVLYTKYWVLETQLIHCFKKKKKGWDVDDNGQLIFYCWD
jgi:NADH:ubiquinone oxidoreductase subunit 6 (subunit J)